MLLLRQFFLFSVVGFILVIPAAAEAYSGSGSGGTVIGSGGGSSGTVTWYQLGNINFSAAVGGGFGGGPNSGSAGRGANSNLAYPGLILNQQRAKASGNNIRPNFKQLWQQTTRRVMRASCGPFPRDDRNCPLVWNVERESGSGENITWLNVHALTPNPTSGQGGISGQIAGYNIRVWRENLNRKKWELILQRQVGVGLNRSENRNTESATRANRYWWYGGNTDRPGGQRIKGGVQGGSYSLPGGNRQSRGAGMVGNGQGSYARNNCRNNVLKGINYRGQRKAKREARANLLKRIRGGRTCYWEGQQMGRKPFSYNESGVKKIWGNIKRGKKVPDNQFGPRNKSCYLGARCRGKKESLTFSWTIPGNNNRSKRPKTSFRFKLNGAPGVYYAVHVFALDTREKIVPITKPSNYSFASGRRNSTRDNSGQFFRVYITSPVKKPVISEPYSTAEPEYSTSLEGPEILKTREIGKYRVTLVDEEEGELENALSSDTLSFPRQIEFQHFTPQLRYSSPQVAAKAEGPSGPADSPGLAPGNSELYSEQYVKYYNLGSNGASQYLQGVPKNWPPPPARNGQTPKPQMININRSAHINPENPTDSTTFWESDISWLRPTLDNPCPPGAITWPAPSQWPKQPDECKNNDGTQSGLFNAWDDTLTSQAAWDTERVIRKIDDFQKENVRGRIVNQLLRCNAGDESDSLIPLLSGQEPDKYNMLTNPRQSPNGGTSGTGKRPGSSGNGDPQAGDRYQRCPNTVFPLLPQTADNNSDDSGADNRQRAQGNIAVRPEGGVRGRSPVIITLGTNRPGDVDLTGIKLVSRAENPVVVTPRAGAQLARGNRVELNFCRQGIPLKVNGNNVKYRNSGARDVPDSWAGDPQCRGYVVRFAFRTGRFTGSDRNKCLTNLSRAQTQRLSAFSNMNITDPNQGRYGVDDRLQGQGSRAYGNNISSNRAPFIGRLPWQVTASNCNKVVNGRVVRGHSVLGNWRIVQDGAAQRGWGRGNAGGRISQGNYLVDIPFKLNVPTGYTTAAQTGGPYQQASVNSGANGCPVLWGSSVRPETCWTLQASYQGFSNLIRVSMSRRSEQEQKFIQVYGDQGIR